MVEAWTARVRVPAIVQSEYRDAAGDAHRCVAIGRAADLGSAVEHRRGRYLKDDADTGIVIGRDLATR